MEKISVSIRVRPLDKQEAAKSLWKINSNAITLCNASGAPSTNQVFVFDNVFGTDSTTFDIYKATTHDIVASAVKGFNGTVFAYGQTSSGKTFTMRGTQDVPGIIPLAIQDVFRNLGEAIDREFLLRMSYMEIYNEDINDLLAPEQTKLQVHESLERGIFVAGLREEIVATPEQVLQLMEFGEAHRHVGETNMNVHSSRSHTIFRMVIESRDKSQDDSVGFSCDAVRVSVLNLVDLAGSERVAKTGAEGARLKEGTHINKSLMVLGTVINKLSEGIQNQGGHVPYRDSKLTRILQPALGGNARTAIICNITPAVVHVDESRGTLQFASRAIRVTNCAQVNEILTDAALLKRQKKEIEELRSKLKESHSEHFEEEILTLRNTLLKSECERERISLELQEQKRAHAERERMQAQKIENLSTLVLNSAVEDRELEKRSKKNARRETWCPRIISGCTLDKDFNKLSKEDKWIPQSRDSLPPPFESLLEEEEPSNDKEHEECERASPQHQKTCGTVSEKDVDNDYGSLPDRSARIHVADRKRKHFPERLSDDFQEELNLLKRAVHNDMFQVTDDIQLSPLFSKVDKQNRMEFQSSNLGGSRSCQSQKTAKLDTRYMNDDGDIRSCDGTTEDQSTDSIIQKITRELSEAKDEAAGCKHQLNSALEELKQLKEDGQGSVNDNDKELKALLDNLEKENQELRAQLREAYMQFEEEKASWEAAQKAFEKEESKELNTNDGRQNAEHVKLQFLERKLVEAQEEIQVAKCIAEEERLGRIEASKEAMTLRENLSKCARELDTKKAGDVVKCLPLIKEDCEETMNSEINNSEHFRERFTELESLIAVLKTEKQKNVRELDVVKGKLADLEREADVANVIAHQTRNERDEKALEVTAMQARFNELHTEFLQERALRETESKELHQCKEELSSSQDLLGLCNAESTKERWMLKTEILKLQVSLDAMTAKSEVFHGRLLEIQDELKDVYEELDCLKGLKKDESNKASVPSPVHNTGIRKVSVSDAEYDKFEEERCDKADPATVTCIEGQNTNQQLTLCNPAQSKSLCLEKENTHPHEKEHTDFLAHGSLTKLEETRISSGILAHTICIPVRNRVTKRQEPSGATAGAQGQNRPRLSVLTTNAAACNRVPKVDSVPAVSKTCVMLNSGASCIKPPKPMHGQRNTVRSKANTFNRENR